MNFFIAVVYFPQYNIAQLINNYKAPKIKAVLVAKAEEIERLMSNTEAKLDEIMLDNKTKPSRDDLTKEIESYNYYAKYYNSLKAKPKFLKSIVYFASTFSSVVAFIISVVEFFSGLSES